MNYIENFPIKNHLGISINIYLKYLCNLNKDNRKINMMKFINYKILYLLNIIICIYFQLISNLANKLNNQFLMLHIRYMKDRIIYIFLFRYPYMFKEDILKRNHYYLKSNFHCMPNRN